MASPDNVYSLDFLRVEADKEREFIESHRKSINALKDLVDKYSSISPQEFIEKSLKELESQENYLMEKETQLALTIEYIASLENTVQILGRLKSIETQDTIKAVY